MKSPIQKGNCRATASFTGKKMVKSGTDIIAKPNPAKLMVKALEKKIKASAISVYVVNLLRPGFWNTQLTGTSPG